MTDEFMKNSRIFFSPLVVRISEKTHSNSDVFLHLPGIEISKGMV